MVVESGITAALAIGRHAVAGEADDQRVTRLWQLAQAPRHLVAVELRQANVEQHDLRRKALRLGDGLRAVARAAHRVAGDRQHRCGGVGDVGVVFHDQQAPAHRCRTWTLPTPGIVVGHRRLQARQVDAELGTLADTGTVRLDMAVVQLDQALHQRQADAEAALVAIERAFALLEQVEHTRQQIGLDAHPVVAHGEHRRALLDRDRDVNAAALGGVLVGVAEQVVDHLLHARAVAVDPHRADGHGLRQRVAACGQCRAVHVDALRDHRGQLERRALQHDLALADACHVEQFVDQARELPQLSIGDVGGPHQLGVMAAEAADDLDRVADRRQRVAQFVREHRQELVLAFARFFEAGFGAPALLNLVLQALVQLRRGKRDGRARGHFVEHGHAERAGLASEQQHAEHPLAVAQHVRLQVRSATGHERLLDALQIGSPAGRRR